MPKGLPLHHRLLSTHYVKYLVVGVTAFVADYLTFFLLEKISLIFVANTIALGIGFLISFYGNKHFVFGDTSQGPQKYRTGVQLAIYIALLGINTILTYGIISLFLSLGVDVLVSKVISMLFIVVWNFFIYRYIIFK